jgi:hypothetical protein
MKLHLPKTLRWWPCLIGLFSIAPPPTVSAASVALAPVQPVVEAEDEVYRFDSPGNGSGPLWCSGSTCLVRSGDAVLASGVETLKKVQPLNNVRWTLWKRETSGWELQLADPAGRTREPSPLAVLSDGRLLLSANPTLTAPDKRNGPARPEILQFNVSHPKEPCKILRPEWDGSPAFTEHSYRTFAADGPGRAAILFQNVGYTHAEWSLFSSDGRTSAHGRLVWPWGAEYDKPQPIRVCYPTAMLKGRAVHFCGVSDIVEPYAKWRDCKFKITNQHWDYDFRRLFYTWNDDVATGKFHDWVEIASRDKTCGWIMPCDLWLDEAGTVHLLWTDRSIDSRLRKEFFPDAKLTYSLSYARIRRGKVVSRQAIVEGGEGLSGEMCQWGRFQVAPGGRLFVVGYVGGRDAKNKALDENRVWEISRDGSVGRTMRIPLKYPLTRYFTATVRGGSAPSTTLDLLGTTAAASNVLRYARVRLW